MSPSDSNTALVPVQSSALAIRGSASLAKRGLGELQLLESAEAWFEKAKKAKSEERFEESYQCLKRVVALNPQHTEAMEWLGVAYRKGYGVPRDYDQAALWLGKAAMQGSAEAQFQLGGVYHDGRNVPQYYTQAAIWWRAAAEQGHPEAQFQLGMAYENGRGVAQNYEEATRWYSMAAEQGDVLAQNNLGWNYSVGQGVPQNYSEAYFWLLLAAEQGYAEVPDSVASHLTPTQQLEEQRRAECWIGEHLSPTSPKGTS